MELGRIPPHDIEAEQAILGCMLTDKDAVVSAIEVLKEESFYREDNRAIFAAIYSLYAKSEPVDIITVKAELVETGNFERVGGLEYLASLPERVPTTANVDKYIKIVEEKAALRELITTSQIIAIMKPGQFIELRAFETGLINAPIAEPIPINGRAGINDAMSPNKTVRTTTGFPQMR